MGGDGRENEGEGDNIFNVTIWPSLNLATSYWPLLFLFSAAFSLRVLVGRAIKQ